MLNEVISEDPEKESAYYYLGYLYEYGKEYNLKYIEYLWSKGFGVGKDFKVALTYYQYIFEFIWNIFIFFIIIKAKQQNWIIQQPWINLETSFIPDTE